MAHRFDRSVYKRKDIRFYPKSLIFDGSLDETRPGPTLKKLLAHLSGKLLAIPDREIRVSIRGFVVVDPKKVAWLEIIGRAFVDGYSAAVASSEIDLLCTMLDNCTLSLHGFAYEDASMGLAVSDFMMPYAKRWVRFLEDCSTHTYMIYVGYGWALARLPVSVGRTLMHLKDPLRWPAMDGYGFHQGYFYWRRTTLTPSELVRMRGYAARAFDQALGRSLWFVCGAEPRRIGSAIARFGPRRAPELPHIAQGAAFAAEARSGARNATVDTARLPYILRRFFRRGRAGSSRHASKLALDRRRGSLRTLANPYSQSLHRR